MTWTELDTLMSLEDVQLLAMSIEYQEALRKHDDRRKRSEEEV